MTGYCSNKHSFEKKTLCFRSNRKHLRILWAFLRLTVAPNMTASRTKCAHFMFEVWCFSSQHLRSICGALRRGFPLYSRINRLLSMRLASIISGGRVSVLFTFFSLNKREFIWSVKRVCFLPCILAANIFGWNWRGDNGSFGVEYLQNREVTIEGTENYDSWKQTRISFAGLLTYVLDCQTNIAHWCWQWKAPVRDRPLAS